jgi:hypothetical protein
MCEAVYYERELSYSEYCRLITDNIQAADLRKDMNPKFLREYLLEGEFGQETNKRKVYMRSHVAKLQEEYDRVVQQASPLQLATWKKTKKDAHDERVKAIDKLKSWHLGKGFGRTDWTTTRIVFFRKRAYEEDQELMPEVLYRIQCFSTAVSDKRSQPTESQFQTLLPKLIAKKSQILQMLHNQQPWPTAVRQNNDDAIRVRLRTIAETVLPIILSNLSPFDFVLCALYRIRERYYAEVDAAVDPLNLEDALFIHDNILCPAILSAAIPDYQKVDALQYFKCIGCVRRTYYQTTNRQFEETLDHIEQGHEGDPGFHNSQSGFKRLAWPNTFPVLAMHHPAPTQRETFNRNEQKPYQFYQNARGSVSAFEWRLLDTQNNISDDNLAENLLFALKTFQKSELENHQTRCNALICIKFAVDRYRQSGNGLPNFSLLLPLLKDKQLKKQLTSLSSILGMQRCGQCMSNCDINSKLPKRQSFETLIGHWKSAHDGEEGTLHWTVGLIFGLPTPEELQDELDKPHMDQAKAALDQLYFLLTDDIHEATMAAIAADNAGLARGATDNGDEIMGDGNEIVGDWK